MFQAGDWVVFKATPDEVFEVANYSQVHGYDIWNEESYFLAIDESELCLVKRCEAKYVCTI